MLNRLKLFFAVLALGLGFALSTSPASAQFDFFKDSCKNNANVSSSESAACKENAKQRLENENPIINVIRTTTNILAVLTGIVAIIMILLGGFNLITSGGNSESVQKGRRRIIYSLIGVMVAALAWTITRFITDRVIQ